MKSFAREKTIQNGESDIRKLENELKNLEIDLIDFFHFLRLKWIKENVSKEYIKYIEKVLEKPINKIIEMKLDDSKRNELNRLIKKNNYIWGMLNFIFVTE